MSAPLQTILVPVLKHLPVKAIRYAEMLSEAYNKPLSILCFNPSQVNDPLFSNHHVTCTNLPITEAIFQFTQKQDSVMVIWEIMASSRLMQKSLTACRQLRIPYFYIPKDYTVTSPMHITLPIAYLIEEREKGAWARSLYRVFKAQFTFVKPNDKGTRAQKNIDYISSFLSKNTIPYQLIAGKQPSHKISFESLQLLPEADMMLITATREYGLDDLFFGPRELKLIKRSHIPLLVLNPREDLYVLCGD